MIKLRVAIYLVAFNIEAEPTTAAIIKRKSDTKPSRDINGQLSEQVEEIELPPEIIWWPLAALELYIHFGALYAFKLTATGGVGPAQHS